MIIDLDEKYKEKMLLDYNNFSFNLNNKNMETVAILLAENAKTLLGQLSIGINKANLEIIKCIIFNNEFYMKKYEILVEMKDDLLSLKKLIILAKKHTYTVLEEYKVINKIKDFYATISIIDEIASEAMIYYTHRINELINNQYYYYNYGYDTETLNKIRAMKYKIKNYYEVGND